jgi:hypothetical protein
MPPSFKSYRNSSRLHRTPNNVADRLEGKMVGQRVSGVLKKPLYDTGSFRVESTGGPAVAEPLAA